MDTLRRLDGLRDLLHTVQTNSDGTRKAYELRGVSGYPSRVSCRECRRSMRRKSTSGPTSWLPRSGWASRNRMTSGSRLATDRIRSDWEPPRRRAGTSDFRSPTSGPQCRNRMVLMQWFVLRPSAAAPKSIYIRLTPNKRYTYEVTPPERAVFHTNHSSSSANCAFPLYHNQRFDISKVSLYDHSSCSWNECQNRRSINPAIFKCAST